MGIVERRARRHGRPLGLVARSSSSSIDSSLSFSRSDLTRSLLDTTGEVQGRPSFHRRCWASYLAPLPPRRTPLPHLRSPRQDHLALCLVSFRLLEVASKSIYRDGLIFLDPDEAYSLVEARVSSFDFIFSLTMRLPSRPLTLLQLQLQLPSHRFSAPLPHPIGFVTSFFPS